MLLKNMWIRYQRYWSETCKLEQDKEKKKKSRGRREISVLNPLNLAAAMNGRRQKKKTKKTPFDDSLTTASIPLKKHGRLRNPHKGEVGAQAFLGLDKCSAGEVRLLLERSSSGTCCFSAQTCRWYDTSPRETHLHTRCCKRWGLRVNGRFNHESDALV